jgi:hypothetical protein
MFDFVRSAINDPVPDRGTTITADAGTADAIPIIAAVPGPPPALGSRVARVPRAAGRVTGPDAAARTASTPLQAGDAQVNGERYLSERYKVSWLKFVIFVVGVADSYSAG